MEPTVTVVAYEVSCVPADRVEAPALTLRVELRDANADRWAVVNSGYCYDAKGNADAEPIPSSRTKSWLRRYRHSLDDALALAKRIAPTMTVNGFTVEEVMSPRP